MNPPKKRNINLDLAKVVACVAVVCLHTTARMTQDYSSYSGVAHALSYFGVPFFMMATGSILFRRGATTKEYVCGKVAHILRYCLIWVSLVTIYPIFLRLCGKLDTGFSVFDMIAHIPSSVLEAFCFDPPDFYYGYIVFWFMGALALLYVFSYFFYRWRLKRLEVWIVSFGIGLIWIVVSMLVKKPLLDSIAMTFRIWTWIQYAMLGAMMPEILSVLKKKVPLWAHLLAFVAAGILWVLYWRSVSDSIFPDRNAGRLYDSVALMLYSFTGFSFVMRLPLPTWIQKLTRRLCPATAVVYPIHLALIDAWNRFEMARFFPKALVLSSYAMNFFLSLIVSFLLGLLIDRTRLRNYLARL